MRDILYFFYTKNRNKNVYLSYYKICDEYILGETTKFEDTILYSIYNLDIIKSKLDEIGIDYSYMECGKSINKCPDGFSLNNDLILH